MQKRRSVVVALVAAVVVSAGAQAQVVRNFDDSWFWGAKGGINTFTAAGHGRGTAPNIGIDWLITRSKGGLYVSGDQSIFSHDVDVFDPAATTGQRTVRVDDMRRLSFAAMAFPKHFGGITPYAGVGYMIAVLGNARIRLDSLNAYPSNAFIDNVEKARSRGAVLGMLGVQVQTRRAAIFAQETMLPANSQFLLNSVLSFFEFGVRYNFGSSIDRD
ncbi:MAG: hypothetical protein ABI408_07570 [Gemmatimonadaceae bacterium]